MRSLSFSYVGCHISRSVFTQTQKNNSQQRKMAVIFLFSFNVLFLLKRGADGGWNLFEIQEKRKRWRIGAPDLRKKCAWCATAPVMFGSQSGVQKNREWRFSLYPLPPVYFLDTRIKKNKIQKKWVELSGGERVDESREKGERIGGYWSAPRSTPKSAQMDIITFLRLFISSI